MPDINILHELIKDTAKQALVDNYGKKQTTLTGLNVQGFL